MDFEDLKNPELQEKLKACKTADDLADLAQEEGIVLTDEQLESLAGGFDWKMHNGPHCKVRHY